MTPGVTVTTNNADVNVAHSTATITFSFSEAPTDFGLGHVTANGGTLSNLQQVNATTFTATFNGNAGTSISNAAVVVDNTWHEANGNTGTGGSTSFTVDSVTPRRYGDDQQYRRQRGERHGDDHLQFQRSADRLRPGSLTANGGTLSNLQQVNATTFTATFTGNAGTDIGNAAVVVDNTWHEANGNTGTGGSTSFTVDSVTPGVTVTTNNTDVNVAHSTATITFSFSEAPTDFSLGHVTATGGTLSNLQQVNATTFTATFNGNAGTSISNAAVVVDNTWHEANGNPGTGGSTGNFVVDTVTPGVTVTTNNTDVNVAHNTATITFSSARRRPTSAWDTHRHRRHAENLPAGQRHHLYGDLHRQCRHRHRQRRGRGRQHLARRPTAIPGSGGSTSFTVDTVTPTRGGDQQHRRQCRAQHRDDHLHFQRGADRLSLGRHHGDRRHAERPAAGNATTYTATFTGDAGTDISNAAVVVRQHLARRPTAIPAPAAALAFTVDTCDAERWR